MPQTEGTKPGGTPLYKLYRYVPPQRVWFLSRFGLKTGIDFGLQSSIVNGGIGTKCAENPTRKKCAKIPRSNFPKVKWEKTGFSRKNRLNRENVQKTPPGKNVQKSQGQIFQECVEC